MELSFEYLEIAMLRTEREVAEQLRVKRCTVRSERLRRHISYVKVGYRYYYTQQRVDAYIRARSIAPVREPSEPHRARYIHKPGTIDAPTASARAARNEAVSKLAQEIFRRKPRLIKRSS